MGKSSGSDRKQRKSNATQTYQGLYNDLSFEYHTKQQHLSQLGLGTFNEKGVIANGRWLMSEKEEEFYKEILNNKGKITQSKKLNNLFTEITKERKIIKKLNNELDNIGEYNNPEGKKRADEIRKQLSKFRRKI